MFLGWDFGGGQTGFSEGIRVNSESIQKIALQSSDFDPLKELPLVAVRRLLDFQIIQKPGRRLQ